MVALLRMRCRPGVLLHMLVAQSEVCGASGSKRDSMSEKLVSEWVNADCAARYACMDSTVV